MTYPTIWRVPSLSERLRGPPPPEEVTAPCVNTEPSAAKTPLEGGGLAMSVPAQRGPSTRWEVVRFAIGSNARTVRLCLILLAANAPFIVAAMRLALRVPW